MIKIRKNTFETNSSSTHAIAIPKKPNYKKQSHINFKWGEFGWEYVVYRDTTSKASYLYTMLRYFDGDYIPELNNMNVYINKIKQYLDDENITYSFEKPSPDSWDDGHVDHGADGLDVIEGILKNKDSFLTYLFDERAYVSTGNDNDRGYYIPGVGCSDDYYDWDSSDEEFQAGREKYKNACEEYKQEYNLFYKGN